MIAETGGRGTAGHFMGCRESDVSSEVSHRDLKRPVVPSERTATGEAAPLEFGILRRQRLLREVAIFAIFAVLAVVLTWPLAANLSTAVSDLGDPLLNAWILDWVCYALLHQPLALYDAPIFHPNILPLAYSENLVAVAILVLPLHLAGASPVTLHNFAFLLGFALSGYGAFVLSRMVCRNTIGAIVGGIFYAFCAYKFDHLAHLQIIFSAFVPLLLAALLAFWEKPSRMRGALLTLAWVGSGLTNIYFLLFTAVAVLFTVLLLMVLRPQPWSFYGKLALSTALAVLILLPFLWPYRTVSKTYRLVRNAEDVRNGSATWTNWLVPARLNRLYGRVGPERVYSAEKQLFPGLVIVFLSLAAVARTRSSADGELPSGRDTSRIERRKRSHTVLDVGILAMLASAWVLSISDRIAVEAFGKQLFAADSTDVPLMAALLFATIRFAAALRAAAERSRFPPGAWAAALWIAVGVIGSFGSNAFLYTFFYRRFEPFQAMRVPARFAIVAYAGLAVWGALGATAILQAREGRRRIVAAAVLLLLITADVTPRILWEQAPRDTLPVYHWLKKTRPGPILELPFSGEGVDYHYLIGSAVHRQPMVNGTSGFFPPNFWKMRDPDSRDAFDEMLALAEQWGVRLIVVHGPSFSVERHAKLVEWLRRHLASQRLVFLRNFDNGTAGDYVFAVTKNLPQWRSLAAPEVPDGGGFLPRHTLERFFQHQSVHSDAIIVNMDFPLPWMTIKGPLRVSGWTLSPHGVKRATVTFAVNKQKYEAQLVPRPDVHQAYPWLRYYNERPGFELTLNERPKGISLATRIQVEVEDRAGRVRRGPDMPIRWEK
jgi:hypothetical protein